MNISKFIKFPGFSRPFIRHHETDQQSRPFISWHHGQPLPHETGQQTGNPITEYQDRWTVTPSRAKIWFFNGENRP